jgi:hypothetical protein
MTDINDVVLQGVIVHKFITPKVAILTINTGNSTPKINFPKATFFGDVRDKLEGDFNVGDHVCVTGNIQSSKPKADIKNQSLIAVFAEDIVKTPSIMENAFGVETPESYKPYRNEIRVAGEVMRIDCPSDGLIKMRIMVRKNGRISFVTLAHYTNTPEKILATIHAHDHVCAVGCVQTAKKNINGETRFFENYVATEISKSE